MARSNYKRKFAIFEGKKIRFIRFLKKVVCAIANLCDEFVLSNVHKHPNVHVFLIGHRNHGIVNVLGKI